MIAKKSFNLTYDTFGNMVIKIPKYYSQNIEENSLIMTIEKYIKSETDKKTFLKTWEGDSAAGVVGICNSGKNGSVNHDKDIYGC